MDKRGEPSRGRSPSAGLQQSDDDSEDYGFGLNGLLPEPESPLPAPYSFAAYDVPPGFELPVAEARRSIVTRLVGSHPLWAHYLWNTSRVLASYLLPNPSLSKGKTVLELGAGAGLPSIMAALSGASRVVVTDYHDANLVANMEYNLDVNLSGDVRARASAAVSHASCGFGSGVVAPNRADQQGHVWGRDIKPLLDSAIQSSSASKSAGSYDLLLLSDLVFNHSQHPALVASVNSLLSKVSPAQASESDPYPTPCILVFVTHHRPRFVEADLAFFPLLAQSGSGWAYEQVVEEYAGAMFPDDPGEERIRGTVKGWRCWRVGEGEAQGERPSRVP